MDEIDSIGSARMESGSGNGDSEVQRTMLELLNQLDGFEASNKIKVLNLLISFYNQLIATCVFCYPDQQPTLHSLVAGSDGYKSY